MTDKPHEPACVCSRCLIRTYLRNRGQRDKVLAMMMDGGPLPPATGGRVGPTKPRVECQWCGGWGKLAAERLNALFGKNARVAPHDVKCPRCAGHGHHEPKEYRPSS